MKHLITVVIFIVMPILMSFGSAASANEKSAKPTFYAVMQHWMANGGNLHQMTTVFGKQPIKSGEDALAIADAMKKIPLKTPPSYDLLSSNLFTLLGFIQNVSSQKAFDVVVDKALPPLRDILKVRLKNPQNREEDLMFLFKILAMYQQQQDAVLIAQIAQSGFGQGHYLWSLIFEIFDKDHDHHQLLIKQLSTPLPKGGIAIAYLDLVNSHAINNNLKEHPFNSPAGIKRLKGWLLDTDQEKFSYAQSAVAALPFIDKPKPLLKIAVNHSDINVQMEAAWALAKLGDAQGIKRLKQWALNVNTSRVATRYLQELGLEHEIPPKALKPDFEAMAESVNWLTHPNEFARAPDKIELLDTREIFWPPTNDKRWVWLFNYTYDGAEPGQQADTGVVMAGSITFSLFSETSKQMKPLDIYGLHCARELASNNDARAPQHLTAEAGVVILKKYNPALGL